jgi:hypothetical protein
LENLELMVRKTSRYQVQEPASGQPGIWCALDFEAGADCSRMPAQSPVSDGV